MDLSRYQAHQTAHLFQNAQLFTFESVPLDLVKEIHNWAAEDQGDDWNFNDAFQGCDFLVGEISVPLIATEIVAVVGKFISLERRDWVDSYSDFTGTFESIHEPYMVQAEKFQSYPSYHYWLNPLHPITLTPFHDDPAFPVIRDGWHRFNYAYRAGAKSIQAMTWLEPKDPSEYKSVWGYEDDGITPIKLIY